MIDRGDEDQIGSNEEHLQPKKIGQTSGGTGIIRGCALYVGSKSQIKQKSRSQGQSPHREIRPVIRHPHLQLDPPVDAQDPDRLDQGVDQQQPQ